MVDPTHQVFWFASRAFGIVAMILLGVSVAVGLAMSGRLAHRPGLPAKLKHFHESATLVTLGLIVAHGGLLLFDSYLRPGLAGITLPFALSYRTAVPPRRNHRGLAGGDPRAQLLRAQEDRCQDLAVHAPFHDRRVPACAGPRDRVGHRRPKSLDDGAADRTDGADRVRVHLPDAAELLQRRPAAARSVERARPSQASQASHDRGVRSHDASRITSRGGPGPVSRLRPPPPCRDTKPRPIVATAPVLVAPCRR